MESAREVLASAEPLPLSEHIAGNGVQAVPGVATNGRVTFAERLQRIFDECQALSAEYRLGYPAMGVNRRLHEVAEKARRVLFQHWTLEICSLLDHRAPMRYGQLRDALPGISTRTLAIKLTQLQGAGFVQRASYDEIPPRVEYSLNERGRQYTCLLLPILVQASALASGNTHQGLATPLAP